MARRSKSCRTLLDMNAEALGTEKRDADEGKILRL